MDKKISLGLTGAAMVVTLAGGLEFQRRYGNWKRSQVEHLRTGSQMLETALGEVEYQLKGNGPVVLVLHGTPGGYDAGLSFAQTLGLSDVTILALSRPGYLRTPLNSAKTPAAQADLYAATLDALKISEVLVVAVSGGGPSALQFALNYPERCKGLVMVSGLGQRYSEEEMYQALPWDKRLAKRFLGWLIFYNPVLFLLYSLTKLAPQSDGSDEMVSSMSMMELRKAGNQNDMEQFASLPDYPWQNISVPTLILHGTADTDVPFSQAEKLANTIPQARLEAFKGGNHVFMMSAIHLKKMQSIIQSFWQGLNNNRVDITLRRNA